MYAEGNSFCYNSTLRSSSLCFFLSSVPCYPCLLFHICNKSTNYITQASHTSLNKLDLRLTLIYGSTYYVPEEVMKISNWVHLYNGTVTHTSAQILIHPISLKQLLCKQTTVWTHDPNTTNTAMLFVWKSYEIYITFLHPYTPGIRTVRIC